MSVRKSVCWGLLLALVSFTASVPARAIEPTTYIVVFKGTDSTTGYEVGGSNLLNLSAALAAIRSAGGVVTADLSSKIGVVIATSTNSLFADVLRSNALVEAVGADVPSKALDDGVVPATVEPPAEAAPAEDPFEFAQWNMRDIHADMAHATQMGDPGVAVAILDSGIDASHPDFSVGTQNNIDAVHARSFVPEEPDPLTDTYGHGTEVSGLIGARRNGVGIVGVAPNVTIVPIRVIEATEGRTRPSWLVQAITYAADIGADVINMSLALDDEGGTVTQFKCNSDPEQRAYRKAVANAVRYARKRGALPVAAAGNDQVDLSAYPTENPECDQIPAETPGVVTASGLRPSADGGTLASYSSYGLGVVDVTAPAGEPHSQVHVCPGSSSNVLVTWPTAKVIGGAPYVCSFGTSFAAPHVSGVAALIISQYGTRAGGHVEMAPDAVEQLLLGSAIDIGAAGEDQCYGLGRVDALRAIRGDTSYRFEPTDCQPNPPPPPGNSCPGPQITDRTGDAFSSNLLPVFSYGDTDNLDIVSAAFSSNANGNLRITLKIHDLTVPPPPSMGSGGFWAVYFDFDDVRYRIEAHGSALPDTVMYTAGPMIGSEDGQDVLAQDPLTPSAPASIHGEFHPGANGTIVFDVPRSAIGNPPDGSLLTHLTAGTKYTTMVGPDVVTSPRLDAAPTFGVGADYTVGQVCIPPVL